MWLCRRGEGGAWSDGSDGAWCVWPIYYWRSRRIHHHHRRHRSFDSAHRCVKGCVRRTSANQRTEDCGDTADLFRSCQVYVGWTSAAFPISLDKPCVASMKKSACLRRVKHSRLGQTESIA
ncbi:hypothetical protein O3P69_005923 [Scylla paramamosain]|uniref:Uncharacterized protein n=1 Tax=Scylla paramamosain TaxID=85552 RepID=A0AAW0U3Z8_SCYPA